MRGWLRSGFVFFFAWSRVAVADDGRSQLRVEISFGSSLLFVEQPLSGREPCLENQRVVPTPSVLLLGEALVTDRVTVGGMLNIPTSTRKRVKDGELWEDHASLSVALGPTYRLVNVPVLEDRAVFGVQAGALVGRTIRATEGDQTFPLVVLRPSLSTPEGFSMYLGTAYAFRTETLALLYGVGQRF